MTDQPAGEPQNEEVLIRVKAIPLDDELWQWAIECSDCGTVGVMLRPVSDETCLQHLELHKVDTSQYRKDRSHHPKPAPEPDQGPDT